MVFPVILQIHETSLCFLFWNQWGSNLWWLYSGFDTKPEIVTDNLAINSTNCIPNVNLNISTFLPMTHSNGILMTTQLANSNSYTQLNQVIIK
jgi:hypothetical protein